MNQYLFRLDLPSNFQSLSTWSKQCLHEPILVWSILKHTHSIESFWCLQKNSIWLYVSIIVLQTHGLFNWRCWLTTTKFDHYRQFNHNFIAVRDKVGKLYTVRFWELLIVFLYSIFRNVEAETHSKIICCICT